MKADQLIYKAAMLLDRGDVTRGEQVVREAIQLAGQQNDVPERLRATCMLGELLFDQDRKVESVELLEAFLADASSAAFVSKYDDLLDAEVSRAKTLLNR